MSAHVKRILKIFLFAGIVVFAIDLSIIIAFSATHPMPPHRVDAVIILGAKVGTPALQYRTLTGLAYYQQGKANTLVLSGAQGPGESESEAQAMENIIKEQVMKNHGKMPHIVLETKSTNTFQNLSNARALIPHTASVVVVSDGYHLARSYAIAKRVGFRDVYWNSPKPAYYTRIDLAHYYVREAVALIAYIPRLIG